MRIEEHDGERWYIYDKVVSADMETTTLTGPSVTTVLGRIFGKPFPPEAERHAEHAMLRGREVHEACHLIAKGDTDIDSWNSVDEEVRPRAEAYKRFLKMTDFRPLYVEQMVFSDRFKYGGTLDQFGEIGIHRGIMPKMYALLDIKPIMAGWRAYGGWQTAAYLQAFTETNGGALMWHPYRRYTLHLDPKLPCGWQLEPQDDPNDFQVFLAALSCFNAGKNKLKGW